jgi:hypothetical protein
MYAQVCIKMFAAVAISMISTHAPINMLLFEHTITDLLNIQAQLGSAKEEMGKTQ